MLKNKQVWFESLTERPLTPVIKTEDSNNSLWNDCLSVFSPHYASAQRRKNGLLWQYELFLLDIVTKQADSAVSVLLEQKSEV